MSATAALPPVGRSVVVQQVKLDRPGIDYPGRVVASDGTHLVIEAIWTETVDLGFVRFDKGDISTEHYWTDRWFSVFEVRTPSGDLKGWYCNVARPVELDYAVVRSRDLELDLWISPDRKEMIRLDEDEFEASELLRADAEASSMALTALSELESLSREGFDRLLRHA